MSGTCIFGGRRRRMLLALVFITNVVHFFPQIGADCVSSCGKIGIISYPFRLKGDPRHCGEKKYELECINDDVVAVRIVSGEFYVKSINYNNYTIRLVDPNFYSDSNCSSLPRYYLYLYNFTVDLPDTNTGDMDDRFFAYQSEDQVTRYMFQNVIYMRCETPVSDLIYVNTTPCLDPQIYAITGDISLSDFKIGCRVIATTPYSLDDENSINMSYQGIRRKLLEYGFEVSWPYSSYCH